MNLLIAQKKRNQLDFLNSTDLSSLAGSLKSYPEKILL